MIALDTNVVVRFLVDDDPAQCERAAALIQGACERGETLFVAHIVLCEVVWVLESAYGVDKPGIARTLATLCRARHLKLEAVDLMHRALAAYEHGKGDFSDYLIRERALARGCSALATFDKALLRDPGFVAP